MKAEERGEVQPVGLVVYREPSWSALIEREAKYRDERDARSTNTYRSGLRKDKKAHLIGLTAECAVSQYFNLDIDLTRSRDSGFDHIYDGIKIDTKATTKSHPYVPWVNCTNNQKCHIYIFCRVLRDYVVVLGYLTHQQIAALQKSNGRTRPVWKPKPEQLNDVLELTRKTGSTLLRYPGGKGQLWDSIIARIPPPLFAPSQYVEPFVGGGGTFIRMLDEGFGSYWINDVDKSLMALWKSIRDSHRELQSKVLKFVPHVDAWYRAKEMDGIARDTVSMGFDKLVLHYCSHGGLGFMAGGPQGGKDQNSKYQIGCRWNPIQLVRKIESLNRKLQGVKITSMPFDELDISPDSYVFCDPPYWNAGEKLYRHCFGRKHHERLANMLKSSGYQWGVTYDDCYEVRNLYSGCRIEQFANNGGNNHTRKHNELFITP